MGKNRNWSFFPRSVSFWTGSSGTATLSHAQAFRNQHASTPSITTGQKAEETSIMTWTRPKLREICIGMEINGYLPGQL
ncbi:Coenzyme PQQ synthesis protein A (modular protein) [Rhodovastum atsumiense]|nr:pyrroloquinoline quinone precursor peptide PqqA [Rhodovastum atsumiense]CAH2605043.1 Coenzyme PQQ synthesis protein A (modular protein) [Rhodovastum atsumiense]